MKSKNIQENYFWHINMKIYSVWKKSSKSKNMTDNEQNFYINNQYTASWNIIPYKHYYDSEVKYQTKGCPKNKY